MWCEGESRGAMSRYKMTNIGNDEDCSRRRMKHGDWGPWRDSQMREYDVEKNRKRAGYETSEHYHKGLMHNKAWLLCMSRSLCTTLRYYLVLLLLELSDEVMVISLYSVVVWLSGGYEG